jgi:hypothetical protein
MTATWFSNLATKLVYTRATELLFLSQLNTLCVSLEQFIQFEKIPDNCQQYLVPISMATYVS